MREFRFRLVISIDEMQRYYRGEANIVVVQTFGGTRVQLPAMRLRPFLSANGVRGEFLLRVDDDYRFVSLQKVREL